LYTLYPVLLEPGNPPVGEALEFEEEGWKHIDLNGHDTWVGTPNASWDDIPEPEAGRCDNITQCSIGKSRSDCNCNTDVVCKLGSWAHQPDCTMKYVECTSQCRRT